MHEEIISILEIFEVLLKKISETRKVESRRFYKRRYANIEEYTTSHSYMKDVRLHKSASYAPLCMCSAVQSLVSSLCSKFSFLRQWSFTWICWSGYYQEGYACKSIIWWTSSAFLKVFDFVESFGGFIVTMKYQVRWINLVNLLVSIGKATQSCCFYIVVFKLLHSFVCIWSCVDSGLIHVACCSAKYVSLCSIPTLIYLIMFIYHELMGTYCACHSDLSSWKMIWWTLRSISYM